MVFEAVLAMTTYDSFVGMMITASQQGTLAEVQSNDSAQGGGEQGGGAPIAKAEFQRYLDDVSKASAVLLPICMEQPPD